MLNALYYPHTDVRSPVVLKNALLLWDSLETIVPTRLHQRPKASSKLVDEARELVLRNRVPSAVERSQAHEALDVLLRDGTVDSLLRAGPPRWRSMGHRRYLIQPDKFLDQTWHILESRGIAQWDSFSYDYGLPPAIGLLMMSLLADACAGSQMQKVTDRVEAYAWLGEQRARSLGRPYVSGLDPSQVGPAYDRLATLTLEVLDARQISIGKLIAMRKRERKPGGADYTALRHRYLRALNEYTRRIGTEAKTPNDVKEIAHAFRQEIAQDVADLKSELRLASLKALFSKEVGVAVAIGAGCLVAPVAGLAALATSVGGVVGVIPLVKGLIEYRGSQRAAIQKHLSSWLYLAKAGPVRAY